MPSKSKNYNILQSVETVNLDDGVEAITQPRKPKISPPFRCTKRFRLLAVIGGLVAFVAVLLIVTFSLVAAVVGKNESGGGIGPTSIPPPVHCKSQPSTRFACRLSGGQVITTERDCSITGCCWNSTLPTKCFSGDPSMCPSELTERLSCSNSKDESSCITSGCCWDGKALNTPCFRPFSLKCPTTDDMRFNCIPEQTVNQSDLSGYRELCTERSCCWDQQSSVQCSFSADYGYSLSNVKPNSDGLLLDLARKPNQPSLFGQEVEQLRMEVKYETDTRLHVKIFDSNTSRYEVPLSLKATNQKAPTQSSMTYSFTYTNDSYFQFQVTRASSSRPLFSSTTGLIFSEQFLQLSALLSSSYVYGLGEHATDWRLDMNHTILSLFSRDIPPDPVNDKWRNLYGVHPFYLNMEEDGSANGVFLLNSNAMEIELSPTPAITYRTIGGVIDLYFFLGPSPEDVIQQYTELIGRPFMPPYWSLGFHLCRWGYDTANNTMEVVERMREKGIPQDTQWNDIDYMHDHLDFTYDESTFGELPDLVENLHSHGQHYIVITDPGISNNQSRGLYPPYDIGLSMDVFITDSSGQPIIGQVWPADTVFPDFTNPSSEKYWEQMISQFHDNIKFDGLWIDMNEPSNFIPGSINGCPNSTLNTPPFVPLSIRSLGGIIEKTLCLTAVQNSSLHYNVHSLYGHTEAIATMSALQNILGTRSVVISRSTYPGSGVHTGHWLGDNASQWPHMASSIPGILNFGLFGIPLVGADICGFFDNTTEQLCTRWQQLGAFYGFSRNHNSINNKPQDPAYFSEASVNSSRSALLLRYKLLPFLYTLFHHAHVHGSTVVRPLLSVFPTDNNTWSNGHQFMWGDELLISPVLEKDSTTVDVYFPVSVWFDLRTGMKVSASGAILTVDAPLDYIPLHVRGGSIIPTQEPNTTTTTSRENPFSLLVALDANMTASGSLFLDDGESLNTTENKQYTYIAFTVTKGLLLAEVGPVGYEDAETAVLDSVIIYGLTTPPTNVTCNGEDVEHSWTELTDVLTIVTDLDNLNQDFNVTWS